MTLRPLPGAPNGAPNPQFPTANTASGLPEISVLHPDKGRSATSLPDRDAPGSDDASREATPIPPDTSVPKPDGGRAATSLQDKDEDAREARRRAKLAKADEELDACRKRIGYSQKIKLEAMLDAALVVRQVADDPDKPLQGKSLAEYVREKGLGSDTTAKLLYNLGTPENVAAVLARAERENKWPGLAVAWAWAKKANNISDEDETEEHEQVPDEGAEKSSRKPDPVTELVQERDELQEAMKTAKVQINQSRMRLEEAEEEIANAKKRAAEAEDRANAAEKRAAIISARLEEAERERDLLRAKLSAIRSRSRISGPGSLAAAPVLLGPPVQRPPATSSEAPPLPLGRTVPALLDVIRHKNQGILTGLIEEKYPRDVKISIDMIQRRQIERFSCITAADEWDHCQAIARSATDGTALSVALNLLRGKGVARRLQALPVLAAFHFANKLSEHAMEEAGIVMILIERGP